MSSESIESCSDYRHRRAAHPVQKNADPSLSVTIESLPHELLVIILQQSLPQLDLDDDILLPSDPCPEYVAALYSLRSICRAWRYLVDDDPSFWKVVCSELPTEVNSALIAKSGQTPLIVHCSDARPDPLVEFMELANSQRSRWATAFFQLSANSVDTVTSYLADPAPQLQSLNLKGDLLLNAYIETSISLLGGHTQNIRKLSIFATPIQWSSNPFTGLKSLQLRGVKLHDGGPTIQHILDILACSPALETFELTRSDLMSIPIDTHSPKLRLPLLKTLGLHSIFASTADQILGRIAVDPDIVTQINIHLLQDEQLFNASRFLTETLPPFAPVFRRLNKNYDGSTLELLPRGNFIWRSKKSQGPYFMVLFQGIGIQASLPWLEQAVGIDDVGVCLHLDLLMSTVEDIGILSTLDRSRIVSGMELIWASDSSDRNAVLDAVSRIEEAGDGQGGMVAIPSFPSLHTISFDNWTGTLDGIEQALRKRFAKRAMMKARLPDLLVKISYLSVRNANESEGILHYDKTHRIRRIDGAEWQGKLVSLEQMLSTSYITATATPMSSELIESRPDNHHSRTPYPVQKNAGRSLTITIQSLPHELLVLIFQQSLPEVSLDDNFMLLSDPCPEYLDGLYSLRLTCGSWRCLVDGNPSFWKVVCSELPMEVNSAVIEKSGRSPLIVHCSDTRPDPNVGFMELTNSQRSRWATALFQFSGDADTVASYLADPAPQLQSLGLEGDSLAEHIETSINLLGGQTQNIRKLNIFATPIQWSPDLFTGLKSLQLSEIKIHNGGPTIQHILDTLACSPALETLKLCRTELIPTTIDTHSPKLRLPLLKRLSLFSISAIAMKQILDRIAVDPAIVTQIDIHPRPTEVIFNPSHFLTETLPPLAPVFGRLNRHCDGSTLRPLGQGDVLWKSNNNRGYSFLSWLQGIGFKASLPWLERAVRTDGVGVFLHLDLRIFMVEVIEMLSTLDRSRIVSGMEVLADFDGSCADVVLDAVSRIEEAGNEEAGMVVIPSFPSLHTIHFDSWTGCLDRIEETLRKRFAKRATMEVRLPDLLVKISYGSVRNANDSGGILHYDSTHRIREMDGVKDFRIGGVVEDEERYAGILAVVWCETSSRVVWG